MGPRLDAGRVGRPHQRNAALRKLASQRMPEQQEFAAARTSEHDFNELPHRPAPARKRLVQRREARGHSVARRPGKLSGPPQGGVDEFRVPKQEGGAGHARRNQ